PQNTAITDQLNQQNSIFFLNPKSSDKFISQRSQSQSPIPKLLPALHQKPLLHSSPHKASSHHATHHHAAQPTHDIKPIQSRPSSPHRGQKAQSSHTKPRPSGYHKDVPRQSRPPSPHRGQKAQSSHTKPRPSEYIKDVPRQSRPSVPHHDQKAQSSHTNASPSGYHKDVSRQSRPSIPHRGQKAQSSLTKPRPSGYHRDVPRTTQPAKRTHGILVGQSKLKRDSSFVDRAQHSTSTNYAPTAYDFRYHVYNAKYQTDFGHAEAREGYSTTGSYHARLPDGRMQTIRYTADKTGYH
ncbi:unnamed protein product, partial [Meganyctiphanes norvegica]